MKKIDLNSNRSFGMIFFIFFLIISFISYNKNNEPNFYFIVPGLFFLILGVFNSKLLTPLKRLWIKFGEILGKIIAPIVMMIVFFIVLTPVSFIVRLFGKDLLKLKFIKKNSYWIYRKKNIGSMKKQF